MWRLLEPDETAPSIFSVDYGRLLADGKRALLFDLDNTLGAGRPNRLAPRVEELLRELASSGFRVGILSNRRRRIDPILSNLRGRFPTRLRAGKPARRAFHELLKEMGVGPGDAVMIGDRRLTDVLGAKRAGIYSILIDGARVQAGSAA